MSTLDPAAPAPDRLRQRVALALLGLGAFPLGMMFASTAGSSGDTALDSDAMVAVFGGFALLVAGLLPGLGGRLTAIAATVGTLVTAGILWIRVADEDGAASIRIFLALVAGMFLAALLGGALLRWFRLRAGTGPSAPTGAFLGESLLGRRLDFVTALTLAPLFFWFLDGGMAGSVMLWTWPALHLALVAAFVPEIRPAARLASLAPVLAVAVLVALHARIERAVGLPWWLAHACMVGTVGASILVLAAGRAPRQTLLKSASLFLVALVLPWVELTTAQGFWHDCTKLRLGMDVAEVMGTLEDHYVLDPESGRGEDRLPIRELDPREWTGHDRLVFGHAGMNADVCFTEFENGRLERFWMSPD